MPVQGKASVVTLLDQGEYFSFQLFKRGDTPVQTLAG